jgi:hypothetical protein
MDKKKKIRINPAFFNIKKPKKARKERKQKPILNTSLKINNVKRAFMERIKQHQGGDVKNDPEVEKHDFNSSLEYLENMSKKEGGLKEKKKKREKGKGKKPEENNLHSLKSKDRPPPPYSMLKVGGHKPTYSQYNKTLKSKIRFDNEKSESTAIVPFVEPQNRREKLEQIKSSIQSIHPTKKYKKKTLIRRTLGKRNNKCSVLINCKKSRKRIGKYCQTLRKKSIAFVKKKLRKKGLLKIGSQAPNNIVWDIFVASELAGDISNKSPEVLLHNYMKNGL